MATLESLVGVIAARSVKVSKLVAAKSLPEPSFEKRNYNGFVDEDFELRKARNDLASAAQDLVRLAQGPEDHILQLAWSVCQTPLPNQPPHGRSMEAVEKLIESL